jgi:hypothetical protein
MLESMKEQQQHVVVQREKIEENSEKSRLKAMERQTRHVRAMDAIILDLQLKKAAYLDHAGIVNTQHATAIGTRLANQDALLAEWKKQIDNVASQLPAGSVGVGPSSSDATAALPVRALTPMQELVQKQAADAAAAKAAA